MFLWRRGLCMCVKDPMLEKVPFTARVFKMQRKKGTSPRKEWIRKRRPRSWQGKQGRNKSRTTYWVSVRYASTEYGGRYCVRQDDAATPTTCNSPTPPPQKTPLSLSLPSLAADTPLGESLSTPIGTRVHVHVGRSWRLPWTWSWGLALASLTHSPTPCTPPRHPIPHLHISLCLALPALHTCPLRSLLLPLLLLGIHLLQRPSFLKAWT